MVGMIMSMKKSSDTSSDFKTLNRLVLCECALEF
jgi:hypothetical protein